jgi:hypothetical protein
MFIYVYVNRSKGNEKKNRIFKQHDVSIQGDKFYFFLKKKDFLWLFLVENNEKKIFHLFNFDNSRRILGFKSVSFMGNMGWGCL